ncbi:MAG: Fe-S cluster assembly protein SufD [Rhodothermales bacterium]|nr:Fe-S cluster assembly protein SufD [Rhodothermales bacterium]
MTNPRNDKSPESRFVEVFDRQVGLMQNGSTDVWKKRRREAMRVFAETGFPTPKTEAWKYTPVRRWIRDDLRLVPDVAPATGRAPLAELPGVHIRTANGMPADDLSQELPDGLTVTTLRQAQEKAPDIIRDYLSKAVVLDRDTFSALGSAFADDGLLIHVRKGAVIEQPVYVHHLGASEGAFIQPRMLTVIEAGAHVQIVEYFSDAGVAHFENRLGEIFVGPRANGRHLSIFERSDQAVMVNSLFVHQDEESVFSTNHFTFGGNMVRNNLNFLPDAEYCETNLNGLYLAAGDAHIDNHTFVDHAKPNCVSNELFKGILTDRARGVFNGKVLVRQDAQKINAYQSSKSIVLSPDARNYSKPELEIYADDVKCSHGATTGELDPESVFYLRSRGVSEQRARLLLLEAFARDIVDLVAVDGIREYLNSRLQELLAGE